MQCQSVCCGGVEVGWIRWKNYKFIIIMLDWYFKEFF